MLLKRGGRVIYFGALGDNSQHLVDYLQVWWRTRIHLLTSSRTNVALHCCRVQCSFFAKKLREKYSMHWDGISQNMSAAFIHLIHYAQGIKGVPKIDEGINPATYALQV